MEFHHLLFDPSLHDFKIKNNDRLKFMGESHTDYVQALLLAKFIFVPSVVCD